MTETELPPAVGGDGNINHPPIETTFDDGEEPENLRLYFLDDDSVNRYGTHALALADLPMPTLELQDARPHDWPERFSILRSQISINTEYRHT